MRIILYFLLSYCMAAAQLQATTWHVGPKAAFTTITSAVKLAEGNDTIVVGKGIYRESNIVVKTPLTIIGQPGAIVDAKGHKSNNIIAIISDSVVVKGLELRNITSSYVSDNAAILVDKVKHIQISHCTITNTMFGIYLRKATHCLVTNNTIVNTIVERESNSGNGVHCWGSTHLTIRGNTLSGHRDGLYFEFARHTYITHNVSTKNLRYGLHFMFSDSCTYTYNTFVDNGAGIAVMYTKQVLMANNTFKDNWGPSTFGLLLKDITNSHLINNRFVNNSIAVHSEGSTRILFENNLFEQNGYAIRMLGSSVNNTVRSNSFEGNVFDITTNTRTSENNYYRNYWSTYSGYDLNRDGIGDIPHHPVRLYALMVEQMPTSSILMNSALVHTLDVMERIMPTITPESLVDKSPLMHPPAFTGDHR